MKRTAAILGPTPPFLRWAIQLTCPFRDANPKSVPDAAFRELRSLRALAVGEIEDRIVDGICLHPDVANVMPEQATGFPAVEIYAAYGGREKVDLACGNCVANVPVDLNASLGGGAESGKAGCFGWLAFGGDSGANDFQKLMRCQPNSIPSLDPYSIVDQFEAAIDAAERRKSLAKLFRVTTPAWYGVWSHSKFSSQQIKWLAEVAGRIASEQIDWLRLRAAIEVCAEHDLTLHVDLLPSGESDGVYWTVRPSCSVCGFSLPLESESSLPCSVCPVCNSAASPSRARQFRVLGLRPYLNLQSIIGLEAVKNLVADSR